ncbi:MAG: LptE family protein [Pirellulales bacterium]|nr:LptE family protein [Pirellulales bacterium]
MPATRIALFAILFACCGLACGCATYRFGQSSLFPADVQTVYVPMFESDSFRRYLGERLTEEVCKQIETNTPYKVVNDPNADSILQGRIVNETKRLVVNNLFGDARETEVNFQVLVTWVNRRGEVLREQTIPLPADLVDLGQSAELIPEYGRSIATTQQAVIDSLAARITGLMEREW